MTSKNESRTKARMECLCAESIGEYLALLLNEGAKPARKQIAGAWGVRLGRKVLSLRDLEHVKGLIRLLQQFPAAQPDAVNSAVARANRLIQRFPFRFVLHAQPGRLPLVRAYPLRKNDYAAHAALGALTLAESFQLNKLRECVGCGRWLFARRNQKACSLKCYRDRFYKRPEQKERRRLYMREYRQISGSEGGQQ